MSVRDTVPDHLPASLLERMLAAERRLLLFGESGVGKSTLHAALARMLSEAGCTCTCIGADPGSPAFGIPGALCRAQWQGDGWRVLDIEAVCTLDAGRFRLPVTVGVRRLVERSPTGTLLLDPPGVTRGAAGAELLDALVETARIDWVLVLARPGEPLPLRQEIEAMSVEVSILPVAPEAYSPSKWERARHRTRLWDAYLDGAAEHTFALDRLCLLGTPPPLAVPHVWRGRQVALLDDRGATLALGETIGLAGDTLKVRMPACQDPPQTRLLVRDAQRTPEGWLRTARPPPSTPIRYGPPPDLAPREGLESVTGPRPVIQVGRAIATLVNGVLGDPLLHLRLRHRRRSLLFDLGGAGGETGRLPARIAHQVSDVFLSHAHFDHIAGFLWLLRSRMGDLPACRVFGPPGIGDHIAGLIRGIRWDRIGDRGPRFEVAELEGNWLRRVSLQAGRTRHRTRGEERVMEGVLLDEPEFRVRAITLDHGTPVLAFAFEALPTVRIHEDRLAARGLAPGPWLKRLKRRLPEGDWEGDREEEILLPDECTEQIGVLLNDLVVETSWETLVYATDLADTHENRKRLVALARHAQALVCEAAFVDADADQARETRHLTARACGEIATVAGVRHLIPFHFSKRYQDQPERVYREVRAACGQTVVPEEFDPEVS